MASNGANGANGAHVEKCNPRFVPKTYAITVRQYLSNYLTNLGLFFTIIEILITE